MSTVLRQLVDELRAGTLRVVDLTQPLGPDTPVIGLPPIFASSPGVTIDVISRYDDRGPAWYTAKSRPSTRSVPSDMFRGSKVQGAFWPTSWVKRMVSLCPTSRYSTLVSPFTTRERCSQRRW